MNAVDNQVFVPFRHHIYGCLKNKNAKEKKGKNVRKIRIVSDSSSDIFTLEGVEYAAAPMKVIAGDKEFIDDEFLDVDSMVEFFNKHKGKSRSSCPNTSDWLNAFGDADDVICITITSGLSGSYNSACDAKGTFESENEGKRVFILDSLSTGPEMVLIIRKMKEYIESGMSYEEICSSIKKYTEKTGLIFMLKSLKNFANNGRVSPIVAKIVGIAGICIVGKASDKGTLEPLHKVRGEARALDTLVSSLSELGYNSGRISIGHCKNENAAKRLSEMIKAKFEKIEKKIEIEIHRLRGLCSFYAEEGGLLVGFEKV